MTKVTERLSVFAFAAFVVLAIVGLAFAAGYLVGSSSCGAQDMVLAAVMVSSGP